MTLAPSVLRSMKEMGHVGILCQELIAIRDAVAERRKHCTSKHMGSSRLRRQTLNSSRLGDSDLRLNLSGRRSECLDLLDEFEILNDFPYKAS